MKVLHISLLACLMASNFSSVALACESVQQKEEAKRKAYFSKKDKDKMLCVVVAFMVMAAAAKFASIKYADKLPSFLLEKTLESDNSSSQQQSDNSVEQKSKGFIGMLLDKIESKLDKLNVSTDKEKDWINFIF